MDSVNLPEDAILDSNQPLLEPVLNVDGLGGLSAIHQDDCQLVIWRRTLAQDFRDWIAAVDPDALPKFRILIAPVDLCDGLEPLLDEAGLDGGVMRDLFLEDIDDLVMAFSEITACDLVDVRLEAVSTDACWKFHRDNVDRRLLTTYLGPATEWVPLDHADQAIAEQKDYMGPLERLMAGHVALFKGAACDEGQGIVHRSPPIERTGETRLLLVLNQPSMSSPEPWVSP